MEGELLEIQHEARSSIELSRDAKGVYRWSIKVYFDTGNLEYDYRSVLNDINLIDLQLREEYAQ